MHTPPPGSGDSVLARYFRDVESCPLLAPQEERRLVAASGRGDRAARDQLATANLRLVLLVARKHMGYGLPLADLVQEGNLGLLSAVSRYNPSKGRFSTYAIYWIRAFVFNYVVANCRTMKAATTRDGRRLFFGMRRARARLEAQNREADAAAIGTEMGVPEAAVIEAEGRLASSVSLDDPMAGEHSADGMSRPDKIVEAADLRRAVRARILEVEPELDECERSILSRRLMPMDGEDETLLSIARRFGVSKQRIEQIEQGLCKRLRRKLADMAAAA